MPHAKKLRMITGILEAILAIPFLGGKIVIGFLYLPLILMFVFHIVTLILNKNNHEPIAGSVLGMITSLMAWVPILGWIMHLGTAIILLNSLKSQSQPQTVFMNN